MFIVAFSMLFVTIFLMVYQIIVITFQFNNPDSKFGLIFIYSFFLLVMAFTYGSLKKRHGDHWTMSNKMWQERKPGVGDIIADVLMGECISYSRKEPTPIEGGPPSSFIHIFEMDGLRLKVIEGEITDAFVGPIPHFGSEKADVVRRLVNKALGKAEIDTWVADRN